MSRNICPRCKGESIIVDNPADATQYLCAGCEIKIYTELHAVMDQYGLDKESAYEYLKTNRISCDADQDNSRMEELTDKIAEHFCSDLCRHPHRTDISQDELDDICCECQIGKFVCDILNEHERFVSGRKQESAWASKLMNRFMAVR